jgi:hypothetical protein
MNLVKRARWVEAGEYLYTWDEYPDTRGPYAGLPSDSEIAEADEVLARRELVTETDDVGVRVVHYWLEDAES